MKKIPAILFSVSIALAMSSCQQMRSTKSKSTPSNPSAAYGSYQQTSPTYQGANPYAAANSGYANNSSYGQYQQSSALPLPQENDFVNVTPATPQYNSNPQYQATPQMGSYQDAANPLPLPSYETASQPVQPSHNTAANTHTVQRGETLYRISKMYGTSVDGIKGMNALNTDIIHPGDVLSIP